MITTRAKQLDRISVLFQRFFGDYCVLSIDEKLGEEQGPAPLLPNRFSIALGRVPFESKSR
ncbi:MAG: hypothetical protein V7722_05475, partial [Porticoccus sp.]